MSRLYDDVLASANMREILEYYGIQINRNKKFICPFHDDSNPSMVLNEKDGYVKCFSCGEGANAVTFVYKYETKVNHNSDFTFNDAIRKVVDICHLNIDVSYLQKQSNDFKYTSNGHRYSSEEKSLLETMNWINQYLHGMLNTTDAAPALEYLQKRGMNRELMDKLGFGWIPGKDFLITLAAKNNKLPDDKKIPYISMRNFEQIGMVKEHPYYGMVDVFKGRVMIPVYDEKGNAVAFCGRAIDDETKPKYLLTANTPLFKKNDILYNFHNAKNYSYADAIYVVEGFMDVAGGNKIGMENIVATMGVSISEEQQRLLDKCQCEIVLMYDNDQAGKTAMLRLLPDYLKKRQKVSVVDLGNLNVQLPEGNPGKDLWDFANAGVTKLQIEATKTTGFEYYFRHHYFADRKFTAENIHEVFELARKEEIIKTTLDETSYMEFVEKHSGYKKEQLPDILHPKTIEDRKDPVVSFKTQLMERYLSGQMSSYITTKDDKVMLSYYQENENKVNHNIVSSFLKEPEKYLSKDHSRVNIALLAYDVLENDKDYSKYEYLHRFQYENVFEKTFIKNQNGQARVYLTDTQKEKVIKQFEASMTQEDLLALEAVEDLYIVNDASDLDGILNINTSKTELSLLKELIKNTMMTNREKMSFFKYGNIFREEDRYAISDDFKTSSGEFKTILLYNNLNNSLEIRKENLKEPKKESQEEKSEKELSRDMDAKALEQEKPGFFEFSVNQCLIVKETGDSYFVRIPNTEAKFYMYIPKRMARWHENEEMFFSSLEEGRTYDVFNKNGSKVDSWDFNRLKGYWDDKTRQQETALKKAETDLPLNNNHEDRPVSEVKTARQSANENILSDSKEKLTADAMTFPALKPLEDLEYKIPLQQVLQDTKKGFFIKTKQPGVTLFLTNKIAKQSDDGKYVLIKNTRGFMYRNPVSLYQKKDGVSKYTKSLPYKELSNYLPPIYGKNHIKAYFNSKDVEVAGNFLKIPVKIQNDMGYISVPSTNFVKVDDSRIGLCASNDASYTALKDHGIKLMELSGIAIQPAYEAAVKELRMPNAIESMIQKENQEKEVQKYE